MSGELLHKVDMSIDISGTVNNEILHEVPITVDITGTSGNEILYEVPLTIDITGAMGSEILYEVALTLDITHPEPPICTDGDRRCFGPDLQECMGGAWITIEHDAPECIGDGIDDWLREHMFEIGLIGLGTAGTIAAWPKRKRRKKR